MSPGYFGTLRAIDSFRSFLHGPLSFLCLRAQFLISRDLPSMVSTGCIAGVMPESVGSMVRTRRILRAKNDAVTVHPTREKRNWEEREHP